MIEVVVLPASPIVDYLKEMSTSFRKVQQGEGARRLLPLLPGHRVSKGPEPEHDPALQASCPRLRQAIQI